MSAATVQPGQPFDRKTVLWGVFASLLAAAGFFLLSTYAPDFRLGRDGGATALSKSGIGFAGLARLLDLTGETPGFARSEEDVQSAGLLVVTITLDADSAALDRILELRQYLPTLFILPKWSTGPLASHQGWEMAYGRLPRDELERWLKRIADAGFGLAPSKTARVELAGHDVAAPEQLQWIAAEHPVVAASPGEGVLVVGKDGAHYVLADPDFVDNAALKDQQKAAAALALIDWLRSSDEPVAFDLTLHGAGRKHDLGKLLVEPPFLALTLTILIAAALAFAQGLVRFGPPRAEARAIPFGKGALVNTTAMLLRRAGRLDGLGDSYATLLRGRAAALLGAPQSLQGEELDSWLDSRDRNEPHGFTSRFRAAASAQSESDMQKAANRLHDWIARRLREHR